MNLREAAQQALREMLEATKLMDLHPDEYFEAIEALRAALAEPVQEPVAWRYKPMIGSPWSLSDDGYYISCKRDKGYTVEPLFTAPPQRKPLTDEEIDRITDAQWAVNNHKPIYAAHQAYARAIERAHGIGGQDESA